MTDFQEKAIQAIETQQASVKKRSPQWMVGEQRVRRCPEGKTENGGSVMSTILKPGDPYPCCGQPILTK